MNQGYVAVTGLGAMCGLGLGLAEIRAALAAGRRVAATARCGRGEGQPKYPAVELPEDAEALFAARIKPHARRQMTRGTMLGLLCAEDALAMSGLLDGRTDPARVAVVCGATGTGYAPEGAEPDPNRILRNMNNAPAAWISIRNGLRGPSFSTSTACSSGAYALGMAMLLIQSGQCDAAVCGSAEALVNPLDLGGFASLMALAGDGGDPAGASRPFDRRRDGFVMGEGGGMLVLESAEHAGRRGAAVLARAWLPGLNSESYNILSPQPGGVGMAAAMRLALANAGLAPADIDYVNAHGTGTALNDLYETQALKAVFGDRTAAPPVSSTKSMTGHALSGAAGLEAVLSVLALGDQLLPPTVNLDEPDPELDLDYVPHRARPARLRHVMSNSFAFGGHNGVCIFSSPQESAPA